MWDSSNSICDIMENIFFNLEVIFWKHLLIQENKTVRSCWLLLQTVLNLLDVLDIAAKGEYH